MRSSNVGRVQTSSLSPEDITRKIFEKAKEFGCDMIGIAPVERFRNAPLRMSPKGLLPSAKSVIVAGIHHLDVAVELGGEPTPHDMGPYISQGAMNSKLDDISFALARLLEDTGYVSLPIAASNIWRYYGYKDMKVDFAPDIAHRYTAVAAGLGEIGWSGLFLSPEFGPRQRVVSIITDAELTPTPMYSGKPLCDRCMACVKNCPTDAFRKEVKGINSIEIDGRVFKFPETNKWRCSWSENFGLNLALKIPEKITEKVVLEHLEKHGFHGGEEGCCLKFCMVPEKRYYDMNYCMSPRRKKKPSISAQKARQGIAALCMKNGVDAYSVSPAEFFEKADKIHPALHLPDAASVISIGMSIPQGNQDNQEVTWSVLRNLNYAAFDIAHYLDVNGYSAVSQTKISDNAVAQATGIYREKTFFTTVLTNAKIKPSVSAGSKQNKGKNTSTKNIKEYCRGIGADMVGIFSTGRFETFRKEFEKKVRVQGERKAVKDTGFRYGEYVPEIYTEAKPLKSPETWLSDAKSVIVMGLHYPHGSIDTAKTTPAETTGPYAFAQYESLFLLRDMALRLIKHLDNSGYRATFTTDMTGIASVVQNPRGVIPDGRSNLYPAMLAGLAYPGLHGYPITEKYGTRQKFVAVITDCPLYSDPLYAGTYACTKCRKPCVSSCPTAAIRGKSVDLKVEDTVFHLPSVDCFSCEWATKYALSEAAGPKYYGLKSDVKIPKKKEPEEIVKAINKVKWGIQKRLMNISEECLRVCPEKGIRR